MSGDPGAPGSDSDKGCIMMILVVTGTLPNSALRHGLSSVWPRTSHGNWHAAACKANPVNTGTLSSNLSFSLFMNGFFHESSAEG